MNVLDIINEYGIGLGITVLVIFQLYRFFDNRRKISERSSESEQARIDKMYEIVIANMAPVTPEQEKAESDRYQNIDKLFVPFRKKHKACRVSIAEYHNGERSRNGRHYQRVTIRRQCISQGVDLTYDKVKGVPKGAYSKLTNRLESNLTFFCDNIKDFLKIDPTFYAIITQVKTKSFYCQAIRDTDMHQVGFVLVEYTYEDPDVNFNELKSDLNEICLKIEGILTV